MVLRSSIPALALVTAATVATSLVATGCKEQSLFAEDEGENGGPGPVGSTCPSQCLGDAARDFDGTAAGAGGHWRYLDDNRDRTWTAMTIDGPRMQGADPTRAISVCTDKSTAPACVALPKALLISSTGSTAPADPAIEFKFDTNQTVQVGVRAFVPDGADLQQILVYRNSREDLIYAGSALPGDLFERSLEVDVIPGDRLLVSLAPSAGGATDVGLELFLSNTGATSRCQVAVDFEQASGNTVPAQCGGAFTYFEYEPTQVEQPPVLAAGPYPELGKAASIPTNHFFKGVDLLDKTGDFTLQYWMRVNELDSIYDGWAVSDLDLDNGGGIGNAIYQRAEVRLDTTIGTTDATYVGANVEFPNLGKWQFVRVVHADGKVSTCLNGKRVTSFDLAAGKLKSNFPLHLGKNVRWSPQVAAFIGSLDDVRAFSAALPCE
jgi:Concanavalin A-like lectin/glucanases superfamily